MSVLTEVTCRGCEKQFLVRSDDFSTSLCRPCVMFEAAMQHLYSLPDPPVKRSSPLLAAFLWTVIFGGIAIALVLRWM